MKPTFHETLEEAMSKKSEHIAQKALNSPYTQQEVVLPYKRFDQSLLALYKEDRGNAGFDLFARLEESVTIAPGETARIPLNVATEIPFYGVGLVFHRSSTFSKWGVSLTNKVGVIDSLFSGDGDEWQAEFMNVVSEPITINHGDKVCQALFLPLLPVKPLEVQSLDNADRGGYGTSFDNVSQLKEETK